jgi:hypothetical protein
MILHIHVASPNKLSTNRIINSYCFGSLSDQRLLSSLKPQR